MSQVLIIEDDEWLAECYATWLTPHGHHVRWVAHAQEALDILDNFKPEVILLDLMLPFANGIQVLHQLATYADTATVPVILCSSSLPPQLPNMLPYGVRAVVDKTTLTPQLLRKLIVQTTSSHAAI